jgi:hypothetical protein
MADRKARAVARRIPARVFASILLVLAVASACGGGAEAEVGRDELATVIARDVIPFSDGTIPEPVLDWMAANQVILLGETHHLREHWEFTTDLLAELHDDGFRQLLVEQPQMADWWLDAFVTGDPLEPGWEPPPNWVRKFASLRELNSTLPPADRIHVRAIDVNEEYYGGATAFRLMLEGYAEHLADRGPVDRFLERDYTAEEAQIEAVEELLAALDADGSDLAGRWGAEAYGTILEMAAVERSSIDIRAMRRSDDDEAARMREEVIKRLADTRIRESDHGILINIGGNHAQKAELKGTSQEWLGDYLVHRSEAVQGPIKAISFVSAHTELLEGAGGTRFDVLESSPEHELFRLMAEDSPGETTFLPLDDPMFTDSTIAVAYEEQTFVAPLGIYYDAVVQYGLAHRMPAD